MTRHWPMLAAALCSALGSAPLVAQSSTSISIVPTMGYVQPGGKWANDPINSISLSPQGGVFLGVSAELGVSKFLSVAAYVSRSLGATQKVEVVIDTGGGNLTFRSDMATTQLAAMLVLRPLGRLPSGAPRTLYLELGGGLNSYAVSRGLQDPADPTSLPSLAYSTPMVMGGLGFAFPVGRRVTLQLFGRAHYQVSEYSSDFLDFLNDPLQGGLNLQGKKTLTYAFGAALRVGR